MNDIKKQEIAKVVIKILKKRFESFPENTSTMRNAPFHKAFLQAFSNKFSSVGTNVDAMITMSSWFHDLNITLGQSFFESVAHILCDGDKRTFSDNQIYSRQESIISSIMTDLKNGTRSPNMTEEDYLLESNASGAIIKGRNFTVDCYYEDNDSVVAIELKSVRPNSGQTDDEKRKILQAKAALRMKFPNKEVKYLLAFPFDPTAETDTSYDKARFMEYLVEFKKFCATDEILIADEFWSFISEEDNTMQDILNIIKDIATPDFMEEFEFICNPDNLTKKTAQYIEIASRWKLVNEVTFAKSITKIASSNENKIIRALNTCTFSTQGEYNERRSAALQSAI